MEIKNELPKMNLEAAVTGCCPPFSPEAWDHQIFDLPPMKMVMAKTLSFLYMPLNMGSVMKKTMDAIQKNQAEAKDQYLILSQDVSPWQCHHYFLVSKEVFGCKNTTLSGQFITLVMDGGYNKVPEGMKALSEWAAKDGYKLLEQYVFYTTCPKCAKAYGHNYMVFLGKIETMSS